MIIRNEMRRIQGLRQLSTLVANKTDKSLKTLRDVPGPLALPLIGNLYLYKLGIFKVDRYHKVLDQLRAKYGPVVRQSFGSETVVHVFDPDDARKVYQTEGKWPSVAPLQETVQLYRKKRGLSLGLGNQNGETWYRLRAATQQAMLRPSSVEQYLPLVNHAALSLVHRIEQEVGREGGEPRNLRDLVGKWSLESAGAVCFERELGCLDEGEGEKQAQLMVDANKLIFKISGELKFSLPLYKLVSTPKWKKLVQAEDLFFRLASKIVQETIEEIKKQDSSREQPKKKKFSFIGHLLSQSGLTSSDVDIITLSLFGDGLSTTTPFFLNCLRSLAENPEVQQKLRDEISGAVDLDGTLKLETFNNLPYLRAFIKEAFRVYPNGTEVSRILPEDIELSGYHLPAGTHVNLNMGVNFMSSEYFSEPEKFKPERWIRGEGDKIKQFVLTPFGHGARTCAGRRFAEQDLRVLTAQILKNFELKLLAGKPLEHVYETLLFPIEPIGVKFVPF
ncbi:Hypothetical predicted protein [Cloeon dipterum]|uniref:Cytochrome P450 CYP44 n=1 Tax=Cloeon dipterum TaxID=197152 RepID=A0A8S1D1S7_9INSE|nr:Hypothetical predicted protein [Cloeon dipterum]